MEDFKYSMFVFPIKLIWGFVINHDQVLPVELSELILKLVVPESVFYMRGLVSARRMCGHGIKIIFANFLG